MEPSPLSELVTPIIALICALAVRATLSFLETSITALRLFRLKELSHSTTNYQPLLQTLEKTPQRVLITIIVANSFVDVISASLATFIMGTIFAHFGFSGNIGFTVGIALATMAIVVFGEILPKSFAKIRSESAFNSMLWLINGVYYALYPFVFVLVQFSDFVMYKVGGKEALEGGRQWVSSEREIQFLINYIHEQGLLELEKREMLQNIFELGNTPAKEVMIAAPDIISIDIATPIERAFEFFSTHQYTRIPVYDGKHDNIVGMIHQKDLFLLFSKEETKSVRDLLRPMMFVPESIKVNQLLGKFRDKQMHMAIVINEYGIVTGLVTLEDIIEEIVGEISDEHEPTMGKIMSLSRDEWLVDATITLDGLGDFLGITFEAEDSISLAGFLTEYLQHIPKQDEHIVYKKYIFQVQKATPLRVQFVHIIKQ
jgi:putative hemolysin